MDATLSSFFRLRQFTTGRRVTAMTQVSAVAKRLAKTGLETGEVRKIAQRTLRYDKKTAEVEAGWEQAKASGSRRDDMMSNIDADMDRSLTKFRDAIESRTFAMENEEDVKAVEAMIHAAFPNGVATISNENYNDQFSKTKNMIATLKKDFGETIALAQAEPLLAAIEKKNERYGQVLAARGDGKEAVDFGMVRAARAKAQNSMLLLVARVFVDFPSDKKDDLAARGALLAPIIKQDDEIGAFLSAHRRVADIDPATGEELPAPTE
jgi:hypothetical protein